MGDTAWLLLALFSQVPLTSTRIQEGVGVGGHVLLYHVILTTTTLSEGCCYLHTISEIRKQSLSEVARWARGLTATKGSSWQGPAGDGRRGPQTPGELEGGTWGPHPHPALAERRDTRIPELGQAAAS